MKLKREAKLALTAIAAVLILIWGINFLKGSSLFESKSIFYGVYNSVEGLKVSSGVVYRGYQVGQVISIQFTGERYDKVLVKFSVNKGLELPSNSLAMIQSADLMGSKVVDLIPGDSPVFAVSGDTLTSKIEQGLMEQVSRQMLPLKQKAERLLGSLDSVMVIVQGVFNEETKKNLSNSFASIDRTLRNLEGASSNLDTLMQSESARVSEILRNINSITANLSDNNEEISNILGNFSAISDSLRGASLGEMLTNVDNILAHVDTIFAKINRGEGTIGALVNDNDLYYNLNQVSENLNRLLVEFRYNPRRFINLSLIDFSSGKIGLDEYGIVIFESSERLDINSELYVQNSGLKEIKYKDKYLYIIDSFKKLKAAQRKLDDVMKRYKDAYIVKIDFV
ncbi:MlaD family protein [Butyricimonas hominis]|jgi:mammalian cell entry related domain protein|uniref:MCE family protein n=1 Tax=Butyricimonas hominis TaxID=2763032 RepID=A0ABR7D6H0_9BACT|nr:MlaD family protein [Butyricimonas hominis]MBC5623389.1 MCE family protein [Butyricimonas hominis]